MREQSLLLLACLLGEAASIDYVTGTCKEAKDIFKESGCCGNADKNASLIYTDHANCPKSNSTDVPFPLPDPHSISFMFSHIIHCDKVIAQGLPSGAGLPPGAASGAVITVKEHYDHCVTISEAADAQKTAFENKMSFIVCDALMPKNGLFDVMPFMEMEKDPDYTTMHLNGDATNEDGSTLKLGSCALTPEYIGQLSGVNYEKLVVKQIRTPAALTAGENAYLGALTSPEVGKQYALARECLDKYGTDDPVP